MPFHHAARAGGPKVIGIDLGTSNTCVAWADGRIPRMIALEGGHTLLPSVVGFVKDRCVVGQPAKEQLLINPADTVYGSKRLVGRPFRSPQVQAMRRHFAFRVVEGADGLAAVDVGGKVRPLTEISSLILTQVRHWATQQLGAAPEGAIISVPAYYPETQREAVREAARSAGLDVWRLVNEPTAASLAYGLGRNVDQRVLVYDLGGGTFDVSVLEIQGGTFHVLGTGGDGFLGGVDFDIRLTEYLLERFEKEEGIRLRDDPVVVQRVLNAAEIAKCDLSLLQHAEVRLPFVAMRRGQPVDMVMHVGRQTLNQLTDDLVARTLEYVDDVLEQAKTDASGIDEVLLVGGQTRMPLLQAKLEKHFGKPPRKGLHPDEVVAQGASLLGRSLGNRHGIRLLDVLSVPIGIGHAPSVGKKARFEIVIPKNVVLPHVEEIVVRTERDDQTSITVELFQGHGQSLDDVEYLGSLTFDGLPRAARGAQAVHLSLHMDVEGLLSAFAHAGNAASSVPLKLEKRAPAWFGEVLSGNEPGSPVDDGPRQLGLLSRWLKR